MGSSTDLALDRPPWRLRGLAGTLLLIALFLGTIWSFVSVREGERAQALWAERLRAQALVRADHLTQRTGELRREVKFLASLPSVTEIVRAQDRAAGDPSRQAVLELWKHRVAGIYVKYFMLEPATARLSLAGIRDGRELVAVEQGAGGALPLPQESLRSIAEQPYFRPDEPATRDFTELHLLPGAGGPVLDISAAVSREDGALFGYVVMEVPAREIFTWLVSGLPRADQLFIADEEGSFLMHYDGETLADCSPAERRRWQDFIDAGASRPASDAPGGDVLRRYVTAHGEVLEVMSTRVLLDAHDASHAILLGVAVRERTLQSQVDQVRYSVIGASSLGLALIGGLGVWYRRQQDLEGVRQARLAAIVTSSADAVIATRLDGVVAEWNPGAEAMFGYGADEAIGRPLRELIAPGREEETERSMLERVARGEVVRQQETLRRHRDGTIVDVALTVSPIRTPGGKILGAAQTLRDITLSRRAEATLKKSRAQLSIFVEHSLGALAMFDRNMRFLAHSNRWLQIFALEGHDLRGLSLYELFPDQPERYVLAHRHGMQGRSSGYAEDLWVDSQGREHWGRWMVMPWLDESGGIGGVIISIEDMMEIRKAELERERLLGELRSLNSALEVRVRERTEELSGALREREILLQEMHHRVKNNLQVISSLIRMQMRQVPRGPGRDALEDCQVRILAIALIHEKLYQTKNYASIAFPDYVAEMACSVFNASGQRNGRLALSFELEEISLPVDRAIPCGLILNELISNACKHAFPGSRSGTVHVVLRRAGQNGVVLGVSDDGIGLPDGKDPLTAGTMGMQLVQTLTSQIDGQLHIDGSSGMRIQIEFTV